MFQSATGIFFTFAALFFQTALADKSSVYRIQFLVLLFLASSSLSLAQLKTPKDTSKEEKVKVKRFVETTFLLEDSVLLKPNQFTEVDTSLDGFHRTTPMQNPGVNYQAINNITSAALPLSFNPFSEPGMQMGLRYLDPYNLQAAELRYYNTYSPFTQLRYIQGGTDEGLLALDVVHSQNFSERFNMAVYHRSRKTNGLYQNEGGRSTRLGFKTRYQSINHKYQMLTSVIWNNYTLNENGGLANMADFNSALTEVSRQTSASELSANAVNTNKSLEVGIRQLYYLGKSEAFFLPDSQTINRIKPRTYFTHKLTYKRQNLKYDGDTNSFFPRNLSGYSTLLEVTRWSELRNEFGIGLFLNPKEEFYSNKRAYKTKYTEQVLYAGVEVRNIDVSFWNIARLSELNADDLKEGRSFVNVHVFGKLRKNITPYTHLSADVNYVTVGANFSDYCYDLKLQQTLFKGMIIRPELKGQARSMQYSERYAWGAFGQWKNDFKKQFNNELAASLIYKGKHSLRVAAVRSDNYIYFNQSVEPAQADSGINFFQVQLKSKMRLGKFHFDHHISWQQLNENAIVTMPKWVLNLNYYFESDLFKEALRLRTGVDFRYYSSYQAFAWMPGINQFYLQNQREVGGYPVFDVYLTARIKHWNGFVKFEHVSQGIFGYNYEMLPNYPAYPRVLRLGVAWRFND